MRPAIVLLLLLLAFCACGQLQEESRAALDRRCPGQTSADSSAIVNVLTCAQDVRTQVTPWIGMHNGIVAWRRPIDAAPCKNCGQRDAIQVGGISQDGLTVRGQYCAGPECRRLQHLDVRNPDGRPYSYSPDPARRAQVADALEAASTAATAGRPTGPAGPTRQ